MGIFQYLRGKKSGHDDSLASASGGYRACRNIYMGDPPLKIGHHRPFPSLAGSYRLPNVLVGFQSISLHSFAPQEQPRRQR